MKRSRRRTFVRSTLITLFLGYLIMVWGIGCTDAFILHPSTNAIPVPGGHQEWVAAPKGKVEIWVGDTSKVLNDNPSAYVLELIPNAGRAEDGINYGRRKWEGLPVGLEYWAVNYPGYGQSEGACTLDNVHRASLAAYDALAQKAAGKPIFLSGYSLGTTAALYVAAHRPVAGLYLYNPPPLRQLIVGKHGWWNLWLLAYPVSLGVPHELDSLANGAKCTAPAFFILGAHDTFVDTKYQRRVAQAYAGPKNVIELDCDHNSDPEDEHPAEVHQGIQWLWDHRRVN